MYVNMYVYIHIDRCIEIHISHTIGPDHISWNRPDIIDGNIDIDPYVWPWIDHFKAGIVIYGQFPLVQSCWDFMAIDVWSCHNRDAFDKYICSRRYVIGVERIIYISIYIAVSILFYIGNTDKDMQEETPKQRLNKPPNKPQTTPKQALNNSETPPKQPPNNHANQRFFRRLACIRNDTIQIRNRHIDIHAYPSLT